MTLRLGEQTRSGQSVAALGHWQHATTVKEKVGFARGRSKRCPSLAGRPTRSHTPPSLRTTQQTGVKGWVWVPAFAANGPARCVRSEAVAQARLAPPERLAKLTREPRRFGDEFSAGILADHCPTIEPPPHQAHA